MVVVVWLAEGRIGSHADCHSTKRQPVPKGLVMCHNTFVPPGS
jgi:hypothetical protein